MRTTVLNYCPLSLIRTIGAASTVLLKNQGGVLPLSKPESIAVIGEMPRVMSVVGLLTTACS